MQSFQHKGDLCVNSTISSAESSFWENIEEHYPSHFTNQPLVQYFETNRNKIFNKKWASCYLKQLGYIQLFYKYFRYLFSIKFFIFTTKYYD